MKYGKTKMLTMLTLVGRTMSIESYCNYLQKFQTLNFAYGLLDA